MRPGGQGAGTDRGQAQKSVSVLNSGLLIDAVVKTERMLHELKVEIAPEDKAKVIAGLYEMALHQGRKVDETTVRTMLRLLV